MKYDVAVIGAGVVGSLITRELSKYNIKVALLERANDCAMGATKANSAIVHAGFDAKPGSLKAKLNVEGTALMPELCKTLSVPFKPVGSLVVAFSDEEVETLDSLLERGKTNGVPGLEVYDKAKLKEVRNRHKDKYERYYKLIGPAYANMFLVSRLHYTPVEFDKELEDKLQELNNG